MKNITVKDEIEQCLGEYEILQYELDVTDHKVDESIIRGYRDRILQLKIYLGILQLLKNDRGPNHEIKGF